MNNKILQILFISVKRKRKRKEHEETDKCHKRTLIRNERGGVGWGRGKGGRGMKGIDRDFLNAKIKCNR